MNELTGTILIQPITVVLVVAAVVTVTGWSGDVSTTPQGPLTSPLPQFRTSPLQWLLLWW